MAILYEAGVPLSRAVGCAARAVRNSELRVTFSEASRQLDRGQDLTTALENENLIPKMVKDMIRTGEHSGMLGATLTKVAEYYDQETGMHYNRFRYYEPSFGRYLRTDPIGTKRIRNLFSYCLNDPMNKLDSLGLEATYTIHSMGGAHLIAGGAIGFAHAVTD